MTVNDCYFSYQKLGGTQTRHVGDRRLYLVHCTEPQTADADAKLNESLELARDELDERFRSLSTRLAAARDTKAHLRARLLNATTLMKAAEQPEASQFQKIEAAELRRAAAHRREMEEILKAMDSQTRELERARARHETKLQEFSYEETMPASLSLQARRALTQQHEGTLRLMERWHRIRTIMLLVIVDVGFVLCLGMLQGVANKAWVIAGMIAAAIFGGFVMSHLIRSLEDELTDDGAVRSDRTVSSWLDQLFAPGSSHQS